MSDRYADRWWSIRRDSLKDIAVSKGYPVKEEKKRIMRPWSVFCNTYEFVELQTMERENEELEKT